MIKLIVFIMISSINCSYLYIANGLSSDIKFSNSSNSSNVNNFTFGYAHKIIDESYFRLYTGLSYTLNPAIYKNSNIYSSDSQNGIIVDCEDIINPIDTELSIGYIFLNPEYDFSKKITGWFNIGINFLDINYLQLEHSYELWDWECVQYCSADNPENHVYNWVLKDDCDSCADKFSNINTFGGMGIGFGIDYKISEKIRFSIGRYTNSTENIDGYDISVFDYNSFDLKATSWVLAIKYNI